LSNRRGARTQRPAAGRARRRALSLADAVEQSLAPVIPILEEALPSLRRNQLWDRDLPYVAAGAFALLLRARIDRHQKPTSGVRRALAAIDRLAESDDAHVQALVRWGILEVLTDTPAAMELCRTHLASRGRRALEDVVNFWGT
jgi:hypothetical protein